MLYLINLNLQVIGTIFKYFFFSTFFFVIFFFINFVFICHCNRISNRGVIIEKIEKLILKIINDLKNGIIPKLKIPKPAQQRSESIISLSRNDTFGK
jgi:hypothetical protein